VLNEHRSLRVELKFDMYDIAGLAFHKGAANVSTAAGICCFFSGCTA
jgi:hypothetical protein